MFAALQVVIVKPAVVANFVGRIAGVPTESSSCPAVPLQPESADCLQ